MYMKHLFLTLLALYLQTTPQTAREYFQEIYDTGGLDRFAAGEVCFDEDPARQNFFIFEQSKYLRQYLAMQDTFHKLPREMQEHLKNDVLVVRGYTEGTAFNGEEFYGKDNNSWISDIYELDEKDSIRIRLTIDWQTHRYRRVVEVFDHEMRFQREISRFGNCQDISGEVPQTAGPDSFCRWGRRAYLDQAKRRPPP